MEEKKIGQLEAASHIRASLVSRGLNLPSRSLQVANQSAWLVFEYQSRSVGIDSSAGVWTRAAGESEWRCLEKPCTVSGAAMAVDFLIKG
jgi:hypothetical protein